MGSMTVGALCIGVTASLTGGLTARVAELQAKLDAQLAIIANLQARLDAMVDLNIPTVLQLTAGLEAALSAVAQLVVQLPTASINLTASLEADIAAAAALIATLEIEIGIAVALVATLEAATSTAGVYAWSYEGPAGQLGAAVAGETAAGMPGGDGPNQTCNALILAAVQPEAWAALSVVMNVGP